MKMKSALRNLYLKLLDNNDELLTDITKIKCITLLFLKDNIKCPKTRIIMIRNVNNINHTKRMYDYFCNSLLFYENRAYFYRISGSSIQRFHNICNDGNSDWSV